MIRVQGGLGLALMDVHAGNGPQRFLDCGLNPLQKKYFIRMRDLTFPSPSFNAMGTLTDFPPIFPLEFIKGKRWEGALFTSYALSLNSFESHWIRMALRHSVCREIDVVTDPHALGMSLSERTSRRVGFNLCWPWSR